MFELFLLIMITGLRVRQAVRQSDESMPVPLSVTGSGKPVRGLGAHNTPVIGRACAPRRGCLDQGGGSNILVLSFGCFSQSKGLPDRRGLSCCLNHNGGNRHVWFKASA